MAASQRAVEARSSTAKCSIAFERIEVKLAQGEYHEELAQAREAWSEDVFEISYGSHKLRRFYDDRGKLRAIADDACQMLFLVVS